MKKTSLSVILVVALLSACGGGGGKKGVTTQNSATTLSNDEPSNLRFASADTPRVQAASSEKAPAEATSLLAPGTLLNLLFVGAATIAVGSRFGRKKRPATD